MAEVDVRPDVPAPRQPIPDCPYRGLMPYTEDDAAFFFGRERDSRLIVDNLTAYPLCILFGPSGVGKSSVLRAGVLRRIRAEATRRRERRDRQAEPDESFAETAAAYFSTWRDDPIRTLPRVLAAELGAVTG